MLAAGSLWPAGVAADAEPLRANAWTSWAASLGWEVPAGVARIQILRDGRLIDDVAFAGGATLTYFDAPLWQVTTYDYEAIGMSASNQVVSDLTASVTTPAQAGSFPRPYDPNSFWNQLIPADPAIDANSVAMVSASLVSYAGTANFTNSDEWGEAVALANPVSQSYAIGCTTYDCGTPVSFRIPSYAKPTTGADHHLVVLDPGTNRELDMFMASYDPSTDSWTAGSRYVTALSGSGALCAAGQSCMSAVAAGFAAYGGVVRPEDIAQGHIDHALFFTTPHTRAGYVACPATHTDGQSDDPAAIPLGARIQLDPSFDVDGQAWPAWEKVVAHALQRYGAYLGDTGGSVALMAESSLDRGYNAWSLAGVPNGAPALANLPWQSFRVLQLQPC
jgi:hypothetical protein